MSTFVHTEPDHSRFWGHPNVPNWDVDQWGSTRCWIQTGSYPRSLYVREHLDCVLVDHPDGHRNAAFDTIDEAVAWALEEYEIPA